MTAPRSRATRADTPTADVYHELQVAYDFFNRELFEDALPQCLISLRATGKSYGYYSSRRFSRRKDGVQADEIALNPGFFAIRPVEATLSTLAHEMTHLRQDHFGTPGRGRYHNAQWREMMVEIGLQPSHTGLPDGQSLGDRVSHYIIPGGKFDIACKRLLQTPFGMSWFDRYPGGPPELEQQRREQLMRAGLAATLSLAPLESDAETLDLAIATAPAGADPQLGVAVNKSNRVKYTCPACQINLWGKEGLHVICGTCTCRFV